MLNATQFRAASQPTHLSLVPHRLPRPAFQPRPEPELLPRDISSRFGRRLRHLRMQHGLSQITLAVEFGIDRSFISDVERGRKSISLRLLEVLAIGFGMSLSELLRDL